MTREEMISVLRNNKEILDRSSQMDGITDKIIDGINYMYDLHNNWHKLQNRLMTLFNESQEVVYLDIILEMNKLWEVEKHD